MVKWRSSVTLSRSTHDYYLGIVEQENIDRLVTVHTSIARGDVWCKYQISPALPQGARSFTEEEEEEEEDDDE